MPAMLGGQVQSRVPTVASCSRTCAQETARSGGHHGRRSPVLPDVPDHRGIGRSGL